MTSQRNKNMKILIKFPKRTKYSKGKINIETECRRD
ncbi:hypothetical protein MJ1HA_1550 [Metallosphaera sedula]|nr:hypothetical protein MJ1HA_1550 [Metallosphaera sedula]